MTNREMGLMFRILAALFVSAIIVIGCATQESSDMESVGQASAPVERDGIEEITVTGARAGKPDGRLVQDAFASMKFVAAQRVQTQGSALSHIESDEELWVISTPAYEGEDQDNNQDSSPGTGVMLAHIPEQSIKDVPLPLKHTDVKARIDGYISTVNVRQQFHNPFDTKIEAVYLFPLPEKSAVSEFLMIIGDRKIRGILREKEEAEAIYREARSQGYQASLLVQHRPNIFEQKVANIEPGESIDVDIQYFNTLAYNDGWYSFVFPTVVGPRYNPPGHSDPIIPVPHGSAGNAENNTSISYLRPDERSGHDLSISVEIDAGVAIEELKSTHEIVATRPTNASAKVQLASRSTIPNRDFVLNFQVAGKTIKSNLMTYRDPKTNQGYFTMMLYPPSDHESLARRPMEMVFVLDCSGSMNGWPLDRSKDAVNAALDNLQEGDTFQIIRFSENSTQLGATPLPATQENIALGRQYLKSLNSTGGTQMIEGIKAALDFPHDPARLRFVSFMTDGYIGNELDIIGAVHERIGEARIFSFGVGSSVNRYLLERMAKEGRGAVAYLSPNDSATNIMNNFFARISHPALTDLEINWGGMAVSDVYPATLPDMFVGRAVVVTGKYTGSPNGVAVAGARGSDRLELIVPASETDESKAQVSRIWARLRIADLTDRQAWEADPYDELGNAIKTTALEYQLMSDYTSFVAVDASRQTEGDHGVTVHQPVPVPDGVLYDTTVE
jgi:Ca-activated chloride channel family protein